MKRGKKGRHKHSKRLNEAVQRAGTKKTLIDEDRRAAKALIAYIGR